jgi:hypothetical protein
LKTRDGASSPPSITRPDATVAAIFSGRWTTDPLLARSTTMPMSDLDRGQQVAALVGRMQATLQQVELVLDRYKPKEDRDRREVEWARENISRCLAEVDVLFPGEANPETDC